MFNNANPYTLRAEVTDGVTRYYVSFIDGQAIPQETEVSHPVYLEFRCFIKRERNLRRSDERHIEQSELTDETLYSRAANPPKSVVDTVMGELHENRLWSAIEQLPIIQRRRFILYHEFGLTYEQIAELEGCSFQAVAKVIKVAEATIKKLLSWG